MCDLVPFILYSHKAFIQLPKVNKDLLILAPSNNLIPLFFVTLARSLPAKSIKLNFPYFRLLFIFFLLSFSLTFSLYETNICKIACDLELV